MANSIQKVTDNCWRCLLDPIIAADSTTITFDDATVPGDLVMRSPNWQPYELDGQVSLQDVVEVEVISCANNVVTPVPIAILKTGTTHLDFLITLTNSNAAEGVTSPLLEVYITWGGH